MRIAGEASFLQWTETTQPGEEEHALHAWVHGPPSGRARGAVVLVPALAREEVVSHRSMRLVAAQAAREGWVVLRLALRGTSESGPRAVDSEPVAAWLTDLRVAYANARAIVGENLPIHGIGLRLGAALLAASDAPFDVRLLWEPVGGSVFLRQYTGLRRASGLILPPVVEDGVEISGAHYTDAEAAALRALPDPRGVERPGYRVVREADRRVAKKLYGVASIYAKASPEAIEALVAQLDTEQPRAGADVDVSAWRPRRTARIHVAEFGVDVHEELLELGEDLLPASYTRPLDHHGAGLGAVVLAPPSAEPKDGPTGLWTVQARRLAARGIPALRVERHHCGDGAGLDEVKDVNPYTYVGVADIELGARWLAERTGEEITGVGLCVGGWLVAMAPPTSVMRRRIILNNVAWRPAQRYYDRLYRDWDVDAVLESLRSMGDVELETNWRSRLKTMVRHRMPYRVWLALGRRSLPSVPEVVMEYATRGASASFVFGPEDGLLFVQERGGEGLRRLRRRGRPLTVTHLAALDHSLQAHASRLSALHVIDAALGLTAMPHEEMAPCPG